MVYQIQTRRKFCCFCFLWLEKLRKFYLWIGIIEKKKILFQNKEKVKKVLKVREKKFLVLVWNLKRRRKVCYGSVIGLQFSWKCFRIDSTDQLCVNWLCHLLSEYKHVRHEEGFALWWNVEFFLGCVTLILSVKVVHTLFIFFLFLWNFFESNLCDL